MYAIEALSEAGHVRYLVRCPAYGRGPRLARCLSMASVTCGIARGHGHMSMVFTLSLIQRCPAQSSQVARATENMLPLREISFPFHTPKRGG